MEDSDETRGTKVKRKPSTGKRMLVMIGLVIVLVAALAGGFYLHVQSLIASAPRPSPSTVSTTKVQTQDWQPQLTAVGNLSAVNGVDVTTEVPGIVSRIAIKSGADVETGDEIIELNAEPDQAQLVALQAAADLARTTLTRDQELLQRNVTSQADVDADAADLKSKSALVEQQKAVIAEKTIRAPFAGRIGIVQVNTGQYLTPGAVIVTLQDLSAMYADFLVPQNRIGALKAGQAVSVDLDAFPDRVFSGKVMAINSAVDPNTRNVTVRALIPNPDGLLRPGMFVRVVVSVGETQKLLTLPQTALTFNSYGTTVFVVTPATPATPPGPGSGAPAPETAAASEKPQGSTPTGALVAKQVFVTTGDRRGDQVAILKGLDAGQEVVTSGQLKLKSGDAVVVDNSVQPSDDPNPSPQEE